MLPGDVDIFLRKHIDSIEGLELMLMLQQSSETDFGQEDCAERLGISTSTAKRQLELLTTGGLLTHSAAGYRFAPKTDELRKQVQRLIEVYGERRIDVVNTIIGRSLDRIREFADAFRLRKEKKDG